jgi:Ca2+-binding RTX toxin-like protein
MLMPKLQYRFRVNFENFGVTGSTTEMTKQVVDFSRPTVDFTNTEIDIYNSKINYAGKPKWGQVSVNLRDDVTGAVSKLVGEQLQKQFDFFEQSSAASGVDYKFTTRIEMLDGGNGANWIEGGPGDDQIYARIGADTVYGGTTNEATKGGYAYLMQDLAGSRAVESRPRWLGSRGREASHLRPPRMRSGCCASAPCAA